MSQVHRIPVPSFDLHWYDAIPEGISNYILLPGGGGSAKTGVKNQIMVGEYQDDESNQVQFRTSCFTDTDTRSSLCSGLSSGSLSKNSQDKEVAIACALVDNSCIVYKLTNSNEETSSDARGLKFSRLCEFQADFSKEEPVLNTSLVTSTGCIITAGDDAVVRVWALKENKKEETSPYQVIKLYELKRHQSPLSALHEHSIRPWIVSAGKDGLAVIWDFETGKCLVDIPPVVEGVVDAKTNPLLAKLECRGCCFSSIEEDVLFTMQSSKRGATFVVKWQILQSVTSETKEKQQSSPDERITELSVKLLQKKMVAKVPCTRLRISDDGQYLAVGCSDGSVSICSTRSLSQIKRFAHHDLPVTGLDFAPHRVVMSERGDRTLALLASCSADNKMVVMRLQKASFWQSVALMIVVISILLILAIFSFDIAQLLRVY